MTEHTFQFQRAAAEEIEAAQPVEGHEETPLFATDVLDGTQQDAEDAVLATARQSIQQFEYELNEVERAVARLEDSTYGRCDVCNEEIDALRLAEDPTTHRCLNHPSEALIS